MPRFRPGLAALLRTHAVPWRRQGLSWAEIGRRLGVDPKAARRLCEAPAAWPGTVTGVYPGGRTRVVR